MDEIEKSIASALDVGAADSLDAEAVRREEEDGDILSGLRVCRELTGNARVVIFGNKFSEGSPGALYLWAGEERRTGSPNARTPKALSSSFAQRDVLDAAVAFANIAEVVSPFAWEWGMKLAAEKAKPVDVGHGVIYTDPNPERYAYPAESLGDMDNWGEAWGLLRDEVGDFIDQYGLIHMPSQRAFDSGGWLAHTSPTFFRDRDCETYEKFEKGWKNRVSAAADQEARYLFERDSSANPQTSRTDRGSIPEGYYRQAMENIAYRERMTLKSEHIGSIRELYLSRLERLVKYYGGVRDFDLRSNTERDKERELRALEEEADRRGRWEEDSKRLARQNRIAELEGTLAAVRPNEGELVAAAREAVALFDRKVARLEEKGVWKVNLYYYYNSSLLVHDAFEMLAAIGGDVRAFRRVLPKFHMERFVSDEGVEGSRYTLWFESFGDDAENPCHAKGDPWSIPARYEYEATVGGTKVRLGRQGDGADYDVFGGNWRFFRLCGPDDTPDDFERIVMSRMREFLVDLVDEGISRNYKNRRAGSADVGANNMLYTVNDRNHDLFATIWSALKLVVDGDASLELSRCEVCGRLLRVKKSQAKGKRKSTCSDACRQRKCRGNVDAEALARKSAYMEYMESGREIRLGNDSEPESGDSGRHVSEGRFEKVERGLFGGLRRRWRQ